MCLVVEDKSVPIATIEINVKNGAYTESPEFSGLSHFYEHMFFKANKDIPSQEAYINRTKSLV
jgi:zinc protease